jgi:methionyl-tRNA formyltransferase
MRTVVIGQAAFGAKALEILLEKGENIVAVYTPPGKPGGKPDPLEEAAVSKGIPVFQPATYKNDDVFSQYKSLQPDLTILAFVTSIIPARYFEAATEGAICYHPSLLPRHRGASAINWAVIMGDTRTGLTIFRPDGGIDTGPILLQKEIPIGPDDTTGTIYFNQLFPMGIEAIVESVSLIKEGRAPSIVQNEVEATYEPPCDDRVASLDWQKDGREIYNLVRGCDPQPGAFTYSNGEKTRFYGARLRDEPAGDEYGTVVEIAQQGLHIAVAGGRLIAGKIKSQKGAKVSGGEWANEKGIKVGHRFSSTP